MKYSFYKPITSILKNRKLNIASGIPGVIIYHQLIRLINTTYHDMITRIEASYNDEDCIYKLKNIFSESTVFNIPIIDKSFQKELINLIESSPEDYKIKSIRLVKKQHQETLLLISAISIPAIFVSAMGIKKFIEKILKRK